MVHVNLVSKAMVVVVRIAERDFGHTRKRDARTVTHGQSSQLSPGAEVELPSSLMFLFRKQQQISADNSKLHKGPDSS